MSVQMLIAALTALLYIIPVQGNENITIDCCLKTSNQRIKLRNLLRYENQNPEGGCLLPAVVFITNKGKRLCAPPNSPWVVSRKKQLDRKERQSVGQQKKAGKKTIIPSKPNKPKKSRGKKTPTN